MPARTPKRTPAPKRPQAKRAALPQSIAWKPQPKQAAFMARPEYEALYGGAAGGGKSDAMLIEALRQVDIPHYKAIIFRKTYKELSELIDRSLAYYPSIYPKVKWNGGEYRWTFPSGAKIYFGNMQHSKDRHKYQGRQFDFIGFDELTHFTWEDYSYMFSRNRASGPGTRVYLRATTNPGGVGHGWVKERFITPCPTGGKTLWETIIVKDPDGNEIQFPRSRIFIPATVFDNKILLNNDPTYLANLGAMPHKNREALLYGSWDSFDGQVFTEWVDDPAHYDDQRHTHVINPFSIPKHWRILRGFDFGYAKPFSVGWYAVDSEGCVYRIVELYGCKRDTPNTGIQMAPDKIAEEIRRIEREHPDLAGRDIEGVADPSIFDESRGESIAAMMAHHPYYVYWAKGDNARISGKMQYHYRLGFDATGRAMFYVFNTCRHFIRTFPTLVYDEKHVEDVNTEQEDHIYDECRYVLMEHPISPRPNIPPKPKIYNPLDDDAPAQNKYAFYAR